MNRLAAVAMIDAHKNKLIDPVEMLHWTYLRVMINEMSEADWDRHWLKAIEVLSG